MNKIYVGNLPYSTTEKDLEDIFQSYGAIEEVAIIKDKYGRSKGFAFLTFDTEKAAQSATEQNQKEIGGRKIIVNIAKPKEESSRSRRSGGRSRW